MLKGSIVALITPFKDNHVDYEAFKNLIEWHIASKTHGILIAGSTGECFSLHSDEKKEMIRLAVEVSGKRIPIIVGTGAITFTETLEQTLQAQDLRADAVLVVTPPYVKPSQDALYHHYKNLHDQTDIPILIYNNPGRTGGVMSNETLYQLSKLPRIIGVKDSTNDLTRPVELRRLTGPDFLQFSGEDATSLAFMAQGGHGCISVTANLAPDLCADLQAAWAEKKWDKVESLRDRLLPLHQILFCESNPGPVKYGVASLGKCTNELRAPLMPISKDSERRIDAILKKVYHG